MTKPVIFEPWALGDAVIATWALRDRAGSVALACRPTWHPILRALLGSHTHLDLLAVTVPHAAGAGKFSVFGAPSETYEDVPLVMSIRGDIRDRLVARCMFPQATVDMRGWVAFAARRFAVIDMPYRFGLLAVKNRYEAWNDCLMSRLGTATKTWVPPYDSDMKTGIAIHVGARWRSRQFPQVLELREELAKRGVSLAILAGEHDPLPSGISESIVERLAGEALVRRCHGLATVIANDSGPMHVAAMAGCRTMVLARVGAIRQWLPPRAMAIYDKSMMNGYGVSSAYESHDPGGEWPGVENILRILTSM